MNGRELLTAIYARETFDRLPVQTIGAWTEALERWRGEGLEAGQDHNVVLGLTGGDDMLALPLNLAMNPQFEIRILERDDRFVTLVDEFGVTKKMLRRDFDYCEGYMSGAGTTSSMSLWIDFPVTDMRSWKRIYEERFRPDIAERMPPQWAQEKAVFRAKARSRWVTYFSFPFGGFFSAARQLMGLEGAIYAMADQPELIRAMMTDLCDFYIASYAGAMEDIPLDAIMFFEDMCSTRSPLISPEMFGEFFAPAYRRLIGTLRDLGVQEFLIDTDGNCELLIPAYLACGITGVSPCEVNADMAVDKVRRAFPSLAFWGGIDKRALADGPTAIDAELERRFRFAWTQGRYLPMLDHAAPPDIPWAHVQHYARRYKEWCAGPRSIGRR